VTGWRHVRIVISRPQSQALVASPALEPEFMTGRTRSRCAGRTISSGLPSQPWASVRHGRAGLHVGAPVRHGIPRAGMKLRRKAATYSGATPSSTRRGLPVETTSYGRVTLTGTVSSWAEHDEAVDAAWSTSGVTEVADQIQVVY
jgi:hypothetical protein